MHACNRVFEWLLQNHDDIFARKKAPCCSRVNPGYRCLQWWRFFWRAFCPWLLSCFCLAFSKVWRLRLISATFERQWGIFGLLFSIYFHLELTSFLEPSWRWLHHRSSTPIFQRDCFLALFVDPGLQALYKITLTDFPLLRKLQILHARSLIGLKRRINWRMRSLTHVVSQHDNEVES